MGLWGCPPSELTPWLEAGADTHKAESAPEGTRVLATTVVDELRHFPSADLPACCLAHGHGGSDTGGPAD